MNSWPPGGGGLIAKTDFVNQQILSASVSTSTGAASAWAAVTTSSPLEMFITGVVAFCADINTANSGSANFDANVYVDIAIGAPGSEAIVASTILKGEVISGGNTLSVGDGVPFVIPPRISAGRRVSVRLASARALTGSTGFQVSLLYVPTNSIDGA